MKKVDKVTEPKAEDDDDEAPKVENAGRERERQDGVGQREAGCYDDLL